MKNEREIQRILTMTDEEKVADYADFFQKELGMTQRTAYAQALQALRISKDLEAENYERLIS